MQCELCEKREVDLPLSKICSTCLTKMFPSVAAKMSGDKTKAPKKKEPKPKAAAKKKKKVVLPKKKTDKPTGVTKKQKQKKKKEIESGPASMFD